MKDYTLIAVGFVLFLAVFVNLPSDFEVAKAEAESVEYMTDQWLSDSLKAEHPDWSSEQVENAMFGENNAGYQLELYEDSIYVYDGDRLVYKESFDTNSDLANAMLKDNE